MARSGRGWLAGGLDIGGGGWEEAGFAGEEFLHHGLFEGLGFVAAGLEGGEFGVHVGEDLGDGGLFFYMAGRSISSSFEALSVMSRLCLYRSLSDISYDTFSS